MSMSSMAHLPCPGVGSDVDDGEEMRLIVRRRGGVVNAQAKGELGVPSQGAEGYGGEPCGSWAFTVFPRNPRHTCPHTESFYRDAMIAVDAVRRTFHLPRH